MKNPPDMITSRSRVSPSVRRLLAGGGLLLALGTPGLTRADTPLIQYNFNEGTGTTVANSGSLGTGSVGDPDLTFGPTSGTHLTWADSGSTASGSGSALVSDGVARGAQPGYIYGDGTLLNTAGLSSFTLTMWVNLNQANAPTNSDRLFSFYDGAHGFELQADTSVSTTPLSLFVNGSSISSSASTIVLGQWAFVAVTYDGNFTSNNVDFYSGGTSVAATMLGMVKTLNKGVLGTVGTPASALRVGNAINTNLDRSPAGMFDDIRIYGGALDASSIEAIRASDVSPIPEPSSVALIFAGVSLVAAGVLRRRRR